MGATVEIGSRTHGPGHARTVSLTDAVVAIAMTLLVLPLVEVAPEFDTHAPVGFLSANKGLLLSFVISFLVIFAFWSAHGEAFRHLEGTEIEVRWLRLLNMAWLLVIVFLPFPTAVVGHLLDETSVPFYVGTMFLLSVLTSAIIALTRGKVDPARARWAWATTAVFAVCTLLGLVHADAALYGLLALFPLRLVESRALHPGERQAASGEESE